MRILGFIIIVIAMIVIMVGLQGLSVLLIQPVFKKFTKTKARIIKQYASDDPEFMNMTLENIKRNNPALYNRVKDEYKKYQLKKTYSPMLEYKVGNKSFRLVANINSKKPLDEKKEYYVRYNPKEPLEAFLCYYNKQIFILIYGAIILAIGFVIYLH